MKYSTTVVALRAAGGPLDTPAGTYTATTDGEDDYNGGDPWTATVKPLPTPPLAGWVYVKVSLSTGEVTGLAGPYFTTADIPASTASVLYVPIAHSDGNGQVTQYHSGLLTLP
jgi:hypothetical protein